jgi:hypothetical protein
MAAEGNVGALLFLLLLLLLSLSSGVCRRVSVATFVKGSRRFLVRVLGHLLATEVTRFRDASCTDGNLVTIDIINVINVSSKYANYWNISYRSYANN